jgi:hypothetical protein
MALNTGQSSHGADGLLHVNPWHNFGDTNASAEVIIIIFDLCGPILPKRPFETHGPFRSQRWDCPSGDLMPATGGWSLLTSSARPWMTKSQHLGDGRLDAFMGIGDHELDAAQTASGAFVAIVASGSVVQTFLYLPLCRPFLSTSVSFSGTQYICHVPLDQAVPAHIGAD